MNAFLANLHPVVLGVLKGLAVIIVIFPLAGACSMAERKVSAWIRTATGRTAPFPFGLPGCRCSGRFSNASERSTSWPTV